LGRQLAASGAVGSGEELLWNEYLSSFAERSGGRDAARARRAALWGLRELYFRDPCISSRTPGENRCNGTAAVGPESILWCGVDGVIRELSPTDLSERAAWRYAVGHDPRRHSVYACDDGEHFLVLERSSPWRLERWEVRGRKRLSTVEVPTSNRGTGIRASNDGKLLAVERSDTGFDVVDTGTGRLLRVADQLRIGAVCFDQSVGFWVQTRENDFYRVRSVEAEPELVRRLETSVGDRDPLRTGHVFSNLTVDALERRVLVLMASRPWLFPLEHSEPGIEVRGLLGRKGGFFSAEGRLVLPTSEQRVSEIDLSNGRALQGLGGHTAGLIGLMEDPVRRTIVTTDSSGVMKLWPGRVGPMVREVESDPRAGLMPTAFHLLGRGRIAMTNNLGELRVIDAITGTTELVRIAHGYYASAVWVDPDRGTAFTAGYDGLLRRWDYPAFTLSAESAVSPEWLTSLDVHRGTQSWCVGDAQGGLFLGNAAATAAKGHTNTGEGIRVTKVCWDASGSRVAAGNAAGFVTIWTPGSSNPLQRLSLSLRPVRRLAWIGDARLLVGIDDGTLSLVDVEKMRVLATAVGHGTAVAGLEYWPQEGVVISLERAGGLKVWTEDNLEPLASFQLAEEPVWESELDAVGGELFAVGSTQRIARWRIAETDALIAGNLDYHLDEFRKSKPGTAAPTRPRILETLRSDAPQQAESADPGAS
ncbi:MAG: WD40 repeat domain-containing protein, partial [Phycisphaerales bacterium]